MYASGYIIHITGTVARGDLYGVDYKLKFLIVQIYMELRTRASGAHLFALYFKT